ncbi:MAG: nicotinate-nucleotide diphosphorylase [Candidatus Omnitrophota bacterium]
MELNKDRVLPIIKAALKEDIGKGDVTTSSIVRKMSSSSATIIAREDCIACGVLIAEWLIASIDYSVRFKPMCSDGDFIGAGGELIFLEGRTGSILRAERTMLNFLSFLSGISTATKRFADEVRPFGARIMDTRKTFPLLRYLEKFAVTVGGGHNHRMGLYDQVLIKDNHIVAYTKNEIAAKKGSVAAHNVIHSLSAANVRGIIAQARKYAPKGIPVEVEVASIEEFREALAAGPDIIMLDNMRPADVSACVEIRKKSEHIKPVIEASGGITIDNVRNYAQTGVDMISVGCLTSSVRAIDMSMEIV